MGGVVGQVAAGVVSVGIGFAIGGPVGAAFALVSFGLSFATSQLQGGKETTRVSTQEQRQRDRYTTIRSSTRPRQKVVGETRVGGTLAYGASTGNSNKFAHTVIFFCDGSSDGGPVEGMPSLYFDNERIDTSADLDEDGNVISGRFKDRVRVKIHLGAEDQLADQDLIDALEGTANEGEWTVNHRLQGIVYIYARFQYDEDVFETGSLPEVSAVIRGERAIENLRTSQAGWSRNPAEIVRWYLREPRIGLKAPDYYTDDAYFLAAANLAEEPVPLLKGGTQDRYTCDGIIVYGEDQPVDIVEDLLTSMAGALTFSEFQYRIFGGEFRAADAESYVDEDSARDDVDWTRLRERREIVNRVRCKAIDPTRDYAISESFEYRDADAEADDGKPLSREIQLPFTQDEETGSHRQQRLCKLHLRKIRKGTLVFPANMRVRGIAVAETCTVTIDKLGMDQATFLPVEFSLSPQAAGGIDLTMIPEAPDDYAWEATDAFDVDAPPPLAAPDNPPAVVEDLFAQQSGVDNVTVTWSEVDPRPFGYDLAYGPVGGRAEDSTFLDQKQRGTQVYTAEIPPGSWVIYLWAVDEYQVRSPSPASTSVLVQNFNDIIYERQEAPAWLGFINGFHATWDGVLVPASTKAPSELTNAELFETYVPYPVAESRIEFTGPYEIDLDFNAAGVRVFPELISALGPGVTEGSAQPRVDIDWRLEGEVYEGWTLDWKVGIIDFRYIIHRVVNDNARGRIKITAYKLVLDVQESSVRDVAASVPIGGGFVEFPQPFHKPPSILIQSVAPVGGEPAFIVWDPASITRFGFTATKVVFDGKDVGGDFVYSAVGALGRTV